MNLTISRCGYRHRVLLRLLDDVHLLSPESLHAVLNTSIGGVQHSFSICQTRSDCLWHCFRLDMGRHFASVFDCCLHVWSCRTILVCSWRYCSNSHVLYPCVQGQAKCAEMPHISRDHQSKIWHLRASGVHAVRLCNKYSRR
jgi:hypothetical protein